MHEYTWQNFSKSSDAPIPEENLSRPTVRQSFMHSRNVDNWQRPSKSCCDVYATCLVNASICTWVIALVCFSRGTKGWRGYWWVLLVYVCVNAFRTSMWHLQLWKKLRMDRYETITCEQACVCVCNSPHYHKSIFNMISSDVFKWRDQSVEK